MDIKDIFQQVNDFLPEGCEAKSVSIYGLPYPGFNEVFVETQDGKRFRALANSIRTVSEFVELKFEGAPSDKR